MENLTIGGMTSWIGLICLLIVSIWNIVDWKKRKRDGIYEIVPKEPWWKQTYIWIVFFRRSRYRPIASTFPWLIFILPAMFMIVFNGMIFIYGHPLKLEEMHQVSGIVTKVHRGKESFIRLKDDSGNEETYRLCCFYYDEEAEEFKQKIQDTQIRVDIWYQDSRYLWETFNILRELKVDNDLMALNNKIHFQYDYYHFARQYANSFSNLLWWLNYSLFGWAWLWLLNRKELYIHRLTKQKMYEKYNLKDE